MTGWRYGVTKGEYDSYEEDEYPIGSVDTHTHSFQVSSAKVVVGCALVVIPHETEHIDCVWSI